MIRRGWVALMGLLTAISVFGAEKIIDFTSVPEGQVPPGWKAMRVGGGREGEWKVKMVDVPPTLKPLSAAAPQLARRAVVAAVGGDATDERFPLLVYDEERFGDFTARVRFQITGGIIEQMAGLAFRIQDSTNFYVVRFSALGSNLRFYKFVNGERSAPIGPDFPIAKGEWHELSIQCTGNRIEVRVDGKEAMPILTDNSHPTGKIGFFTKSDSEANFMDFRLDYRPLETLAVTLVRTTLADQPRLMDLQVLGRLPGSEKLQVMAAKSASDVGRAASDTENKVWAENRPYYARTKAAAVVTQPLHDRNGDVLGVVRFALKPYAGQLEAATLARVLPILKDMEMRIGASKDLIEYGSGGSGQGGRSGFTPDVSWASRSCLANLLLSHP